MMSWPILGQGDRKILLNLISIACHRDPWLKGPPQKNRFKIPINTTYKK